MQGVVTIWRSSTLLNFTLRHPTSSPASLAEIILMCYHTWLSVNELHWLWGGFPMFFFENKVFTKIPIVHFQNIPWSFSSLDVQFEFDSQTVMPTHHLCECFTRVHFEKCWNSFTFNKALQPIWEKNWGKNLPLPTRVTTNRIRGRHIHSEGRSHGYGWCIPARNGTRRKVVKSSPKIKTWIQCEAQVLSNWRSTLYKRHYSPPHELSWVNNPLDQYRCFWYLSNNVCRQCPVDALL